MSATLSPSQDKPYGVARVCSAWEIARSTFYDWRTRASNPERPAPQKRGPKTELSDDELVERIRLLFEELERDHSIRGEGYRKVRARLRHAGVRVGRERVLRLMREHGLLAPTRVGGPRGPHVHDGTIVTDQPDVMWGMDMTTTLTLEEGNASIFAVVDHCTSECLALHAVARGTRFEAVAALDDAVREVFASVDVGAADGVALRHDHGSQFTSHRFQAELGMLGMVSSPSFVRAPEGNGCAERFFRTLKEQLLWIRSFDTIEQLRAALDEFRRTYNTHWILARHGYLTPRQVRELKTATPSQAA